VKLAKSFGFFLVVLLLSPAWAHAMPNSFADLAASQGDAVVNISTTQISRDESPPGFPRGMPHGSPFDRYFHDFFKHRPPQERHALGTGFIISSDGYVVTNNHVIDGADEIVVKTDKGKEYKAKVIGADTKLDVALLKVDAKGLATVHLGDSNKLRVGDWVVAIGNPFGLEQTVTAGIVSAKGRVIGAGPYDHFIQTDAAINPGNSGGPLFDTAGEVVGINTAIYSRDGGNNGIGFAIPINMAKPIINELRKTGHVTRARLGVYITEVDDDTVQALGLKSKQGALVRQVKKDSAADKAGIKPGDVIVGVDDTPIKSVHDLPILISSHKPGDRIKVRLVRDGHPMTITARVEKMPEEATRASRSHRHRHETVSDTGMVLDDLTPDLARQLDVNITHGVVVQEVQPGSAASQAGIERGDVIFQINRRPLKSLDQFNAIASRFKPGDVVQFLLNRHGSTVFAILRLPPERKGR